MKDFNIGDKIILILDWRENVFMNKLPICTNSETNDDYVALKNFMLDISCLNDLDEWTNKFNIFDVLKISRTEIRHSNILAWLLDPNENHKMNDFVIKGFFEKLFQKNLISLDIFDTLLMNFYDFKVFREWKNIDIFLLSDESKLAVCIENKVYSSEHDDQLKKYMDIIEKHYPNYKKLCIFLTPHGDAASDHENWISISYSDILNIIVDGMNKTPLFDEVELLLKNYIETVRWHIVGDERLVNICNDIYKKHKRALDLIFENKNDSAKEISDFIAEYCIDLSTKTNKIIFDKEHSAKKFIRFTTPTMSEILPNNSGVKDGWNTYNHYFYEIINYNNKIRIGLPLSKGNFTVEERDSYFSEFFKLNSVNKPNRDWTWNTFKTWEVLKYSEDDTLEDIKDRLIENLNNAFKKVEHFENDLKSKL